MTFKREKEFTPTKESQYAGERYATPHEMRYLDEVGYGVVLVKPIKWNERGYLVRLYGKGA